MSGCFLPKAVDCCGCGACRAVCSCGAISMAPDEDGFLHPKMDASKCIGCGRCEKACPILHPGEKRRPVQVYAAKAKDDVVRWGSSSGGVFTLLARKIIARGGVVFGAGFETGTWRIIHKPARTLEELEDLRGSKYVQSDIGDAFSMAKSCLDAGQEVLFSGCPCQVAALKRFLGRDFPQLLTVDLICHGIPSPFVWQRYLGKRQKAVARRITEVVSRRFCDWSRYCIQISFEGEREPSYSKDRWTDPFMISFVSFWGLRDSCLRCCFRGFSSGSDITLGDYNNAQEIFGGLRDENGVSAVIIHSERGINAVGSVLGDMDVRTATVEHLAKANPSIFKNEKTPRLRKEFLRRVKNEDFDELVSGLSGRRQGSLTMHLLWWAKRLVVNREWNEIRWR